MQIDLQKLLNYLLLGLAVCGGVIAGGLSGQVVDLLLSSEETLLPEPQAAQPVVRQLQAADFQVILDRNLFDSQAVGKSTEPIDLSAQPAVAQTAGSAQPQRGEMVLVGTVVAGDNSLALIQVGRKTGVFRLRGEISPGVEVVEITRQMVVVSERGIRRELLLKPRKESQTRLIRQGTTVGASDVVALGGNRWRVSRAAADNARANLNRLLQTARMVPQLRNGKTIGFKLVEIEKGSLLERIGLRVGDLIVEINQVKLNSPEKALQVFQQVREANDISLGLVRNGQRQTFEYRFE